MNRKEALHIVKQQLTEKRYEHTVRVMETAIKLAKRYQVDPIKAELAAIFHDYAKFRPKQEMKNIIINQSLPSLLLRYHHELWHAPVGAYLTKHEVGIRDEEILQAIRFHTTGNPEMKTLDKIVYLADYIEPGRRFPGVDEARRIANDSLDQAVIFALKNTIIFLMEKGQPVYPDTFKFYNFLMMNKEETE